MRTVKDIFPNYIVRKVGKCKPLKGPGKMLCKFRRDCFHCFQRETDILGYLWKTSRMWTDADEVKGIPGGETT